MFVDKMINKVFSSVGLFLFGGVVRSTSDQRAKNLNLIWNKLLTNYLMLYAFLHIDYYVVVRKKKMLN